MTRQISINEKNFSPQEWDKIDLLVAHRQLALAAEMGLRHVLQEKNLMILQGANDAGKTSNLPTE